MLTHNADDVKRARAFELAHVSVYQHSWSQGALDDLLAAVREEGATEEWLSGYVPIADALGYAEWHEGHVQTADVSTLLRAIAEMKGAAAAEREACATIAEEKAVRAEYDDQINGEACLDIARDIRARGDK